MVNVAGGEAVDEAAVGTAPPPEQVSVDRPTVEGGLVRTADAGKLPTFYLVAICAVTLAGFLVRLPSFNDSLFGDEISTFYIVNGHSLGRMLSLIYSGKESTPPLYFILAWITKGWLGAAHAAQGIRLGSLVTGTAAIPLTFVLGRLTVGRRAALVGAVCVACSPYMIFYSTEARAYMLVLFLGLVSSICLLRAIATNRFAWWAGYAASSCAAVYSHYSVVFFLVALFVWAFFAAPRARKALIWSSVAAVVGFLPGAAGIPAGLKAPNYLTYVEPVDLHDLRDIGERFWVGHAGLPMHEVPGNVAILMAAAGLALGVFGAILVARHRGPQWWRLRSEVLLIGILAVAPFVLMVAYSLLKTDVLGGPNIIASWPAMSLVIGALVTVPPKPVRVAAVALVVGAYAIGAWQMTRPVYQRGNIAGAVAFIQQTGHFGDPIVTMPAFSNPLSEVDVALSGTPSYTYIPDNTRDRARSTYGDPHPVIRLQAPLAAPPLDEQFKALTGPRPDGFTFGFWAPPGGQVAQQAMSEAGHGTVFLMTPWPVKVGAWFKYYPNAPMSKFLGTMLTKYHVVRQVRFPSYSVYNDGEYVNVFRKNS
jgi:4-amino-4-deoxy-L-arabinose transferase-like glycosyltransferase